MPINSNNREPPLSITGSLSISSDDFHFKLLFTSSHFAADFPSLGMLLQANRKKKEFLKMIEGVPVPLPLSSAYEKRHTSEPQNLFLKKGFIYAAVKGHPVGRFRLRDGKLVFRATPLRFLSKLK